MFLDQENQYKGFLKSKISLKRFGVEQTVKTPSQREKSVSCGKFCHGFQRVDHFRKREWQREGRQNETGREDSIEEAGKRERCGMTGWGHVRHGE